MKTRSIFPAALLAVLGFAAGIVVDRYAMSRSKPVSPGAVEKVASGTTAHGSNTMPAGPHGATTHEEREETMSLEQVKTAIQNSTKRGLQQRYEAMSKLVAAVAPADLPEVLTLAEKTAPEAFRTRFRNELLERWAENDPTGAMAYAEKVQGAQRRQEAIMAVLGKWAEQDLDRAAAWAKQLPAGPIKAEALQTVVSAMAEKDPEKAMALVQSSGLGSEVFHSSIFESWAKA